MRTILNLFGCKHRLGFPITLRRRGTYRVCVICGKEFVYSWQEMKIAGELKKVPAIGEVRRREA